MYMNGTHAENNLGILSIFLSNMHYPINSQIIEFFSLCDVSTISFNEYNEMLVTHVTA